RLPDYLRAQAAAVKEAERRKKEAERAKKVAEKLQADRRAHEGAAEAEQRNASLAQAITGLNSLLSATLAVDDYVDFESLKDSTDMPAFEPGALGVAAVLPQYEPPVLQIPPPLSAVHRIVPGAKKRHE